MSKLCVAGEEFLLRSEGSSEDQGKNLIVSMGERGLCRDKDGLEGQDQSLLILLLREFFSGVLAYTSNTCGLFLVFLRVVLSGTQQETMVSKIGY